MKRDNKYMLAWDRLMGSESNQEIRKLMKRKMKAGVPASKFSKLLNDWRSAQTRDVKKNLKKQLRAL